MGDDPLVCYRRVLQHWVGLHENAVDEEMALARLTPPGERSPEQKVICVIGLQLRATASRQRALLGSIRIPLDHPRTPRLDQLKGLDTIRAVSFNPITGCLISCTLREFLRVESCRRGLVLLGDAGYGKTPAAHALCRVLSAACQEEEEKFYLCTSQLDSLRAAQHLQVQGTSILMDEWSPTTSRGGRTKTVSREEALALFTVHSPQVIPTRYGDTRLMPGARVFTHNSNTLQQWHPDLVDFTLLTDCRLYSSDAADDPPAFDSVELPGSVPHETIPREHYLKRN